MPAPITRTSALLTLTQWMQTHERPPSAGECRNRYGLQHLDTYTRLFSSLSGALSCAWEVLAQSPTAFSALVSSQTWACLGCGCPIRREAAHIRHCLGCRKRLFIAARREAEVPGALPSSIVRQCWAESWDDLLEEATYLCH